MKTNEKHETPRLRELPQVPVDYTLMVSTLLCDIVTQKDSQTRNGLCAGLFGVLKAGHAVGLLPLPEHYRAVGIVVDTRDACASDGKVDFGHMLDRLLSCLGPAVATVSGLNREAFVREFLCDAYELSSEDLHDPLRAPRTALRNILQGLLMGGTAVGLLDQEQQTEGVRLVDRLYHSKTMKRWEIYQACAAFFGLGEDFLQEELSWVKFQLPETAEVMA